MISIILLSFFLLGTQALPFPEDLQIHDDGLGNYQYQSVDKSGTRLSESGQIVDIKGKPVNVKQGDFAYVAPDTKQPISLTWQADDKGFKPSGAHLPTPPPIPVEIATSLAEKNQRPPFGPGSLQGRSLSHFGMPVPMLYY